MRKSERGTLADAEAWSSEQRDNPAPYSCSEPLGIIFPRGIGRLTGTFPPLAPSWSPWMSRGRRGGTRGAPRHDPPQQDRSGRPGRRDRPPARGRSLVRWRRSRAWIRIGPASHLSPPIVITASPDCRCPRPARTGPVSAENSPTARGPYHIYASQHQVHLRELLRGNDCKRKTSCRALLRGRAAYASGAHELTAPVPCAVLQRQAPRRVLL